MEPIYIVGAGPGDPDLITVKGRNLLARADVVVYTNSLLPDAMLVHCQPSAEIIPSADKNLEQIIEILSSRWRSQKLVIRLHDGDPCLYSAISEQINQLQAQNIPLEIIPGISAYQVAAARLQTELTIPQLVQTVILTRTGRNVPENLSDLARHQATLCLYLSANQIETAQTQLLSHYHPNTPVAICHHLCWETEKIITIPLADLATTSRALELRRTTLYIISPALVKAAPQPSQLYSSHHQHLFRPQKNYPQIFAGS